MSGEDSREREQLSPEPTVAPDADFYREGPFIVFTERFLRARGYCCESGCRHCPWDFRLSERGDVPRA